MIKKRSARLTLLTCASIASLGLLAGASPAAAKTVQKTATVNVCASGAVPIPDFPTTSGGDPGNSPVSSAALAVPVTVPKFKGKPQDGVVTAFNFAGVRITHTFVGDLQLQLVSPGGRVAALAYRRGDVANDGDGYGSGAASCTGSLVRFGDGFPNSILTPGNTGDNPIVGDFRPEQSVGQFVGGPARGFWTLVVTDIDAPDVGQINAVSVNLTYQYKALKKKKKKGKK
jgi:Proprotein convertase P-domain